MFRFKTILLLFVAIFALTMAAKKQKTQKVIYVRAKSPVRRQLSQYEQCKMSCEVQRDAQTKQEQVEQLRRELEEAEKMLGEQYPETVDKMNGETILDNAHRKPSRYDHLKMAATKFTETGSELKNAVTGGSSN